MQDKYILDVYVCHGLGNKNYFVSKQKKCSKGSKGNKQDYNTGVGKNEKEDKNLLSFSAVLGGDI